MPNAALLSNPAKRRAPLPGTRAPAVTTLSVDRALSECVWPRPGCCLHTALMLSVTQPHTAAHGSGTGRVCLAPGDIVCPTSAHAATKSGMQRRHAHAGRKDGAACRTCSPAPADATAERVAPQHCCCGCGLLAAGCAAARRLTGCESTDTYPPPVRGPTMHTRRNRDTVIAERVCAHASARTFSATLP